MKHTLRHRFPWMAVSGALIAAGTTVPATSQPDGSSGPKSENVVISIAVFKTDARGATVRVGSASGGTGVFALAGGFDSTGRPEREICMSAVGASGPDDEGAARSVHVWKAKFDVLSASMEGVSLRVDWTRESAERAGFHRVAAGDIRTITLKEGESHTLDFLGAPDGSRECGTNLRIDVKATIAEDERFVDRRLAYDLWLVDEAQGTPAVMKHLTGTARHGERFDFTIPSIRWPVPGGEFRDGSVVEVVASVSGSLRGRLRPDGSIDLYLEAARGIGMAPAGLGWTGSVGDGGQKALRVAPGEVLSLVLPEAAGTVAMGLDRSWSSVSGAREMTSYGRDALLPGAGIEIGDDSIAVNLGQFLARHAMSLRLTAREVTD